MPEKTIEQTALFTRMVAEKQNWLVNPDKEFTDSLVEGLTVNFNRYGYYLCPCRDTEGSRELDADVLCPCTYSWQDIEEHGHCYCALFLSKKFAASGAQASGIADRRGS
ncbi:MAG: ferredoxin:thioredoxin reductase [Spirochaetes bacterium]|nr:ferredoxin:thioredoxin reductase [Spirochaetota bacterium]MBU0956279.1 ferredoxin:thioredoxin reductase [Spirochaetota bacterium]